MGWDQLPWEGISCQAFPPESTRLAQLQGNTVFQCYRCNRNSFAVNHSNTRVAQP